MNSRIDELSRRTEALLQGIDCYPEAKKLADANAELREAIQALKTLNWDSLFALDEAERQELTACQQKVRECYAKLKRVLLETYKELFTAIKGM
jgi:hypothetical protein